MDTKILKINFILQNGDVVQCDAVKGETILTVAHRNKEKFDLEGACEGSLACSTCHVIVEPNWYELLNDIIDEENDMLDLAFGLTETSRLGCQIVLTDELDGLTLRLPAATRNVKIS